MESISPVLVITFGLIIGSFLNVVIYRLPLATFKKKSAIKNLLWPPSFAPCCKKPIAWFENIPVFSWLFLQGRCRNCKKKISLRYPLIELLTAFVFYFTFIKMGLTYQTALWFYFFSILIPLAYIDIDHFLLPDVLTLNLIVMGLLGSFIGFLSLDFKDSCLGALLGFLIPWSVNKLYFLWKKRDGFGGGDFKLLSGIGAWLGWAKIIPILTLSSLLALTYTLLLLVIGKKITLNTALPFGPFLIISSAFFVFYTHSTLIGLSL
jgi:prepilin signal peptidase PulO-like enzyme (type II secretory pathway)